jgi:predicted Zn-ribbon and HTH transcriptional regulator
MYLLSYIQGDFTLKYVLSVGKEFAVLEAKLAAENLERTWKLQEADLVRVELIKRRREKEAAQSSAAKRQLEMNRITEVADQQLKQISALRSAESAAKTSKKRSSAIIASNTAAPPQVSSTPFKFSSDHTKKVSKAPAPEASHPETEPLYRLPPSDKVDTADEFVQMAVRRDPRLFEVKYNIPLILYECFVK